MYYIAIKVSFSRKGSLPFEQLNPSEFEDFLLAFLQSGPVLPAKQPDGGIRRLKIADARKAPGTGLGQGGYDILATTDDGSHWLFECKHHSEFKGTWGLGSEASDVKKPTTVWGIVKKAEAANPAADYFTFVTNGKVRRDAAYFLEGRQRWHFWSENVLASTYLQRCPRPNGYRILNEFFSEAVARQKYPRNDDLLVGTDEFFAKPRRYFHHKAPLIGRTQDLESLRAFVEDPEYKVLLVCGRGGTGKTRLLRSLSESCKTRTVQFINPKAPTKGASDGLSRHELKSTVIVHDDAHRLETFQEDVLAAVQAAPGAKLIIATRPHAAGAVRNRLREVGIGIESIAGDHLLSDLKPDELLQLAKESLDPPHKRFAASIADLSDSSPLVCSVACELQNQEKLQFDRDASREVFASTVFDRLTDGIFNGLASDSEKEILRVLQSLAILSPFDLWTGENQERLAKALEISEIKLDELINHVLSSELLTETENGFRILPDLFGDHLVESASISNSGKPSQLAKRLVDKFGGSALITLMRNLSAAEWKLSLRGASDTGQLTRPLWKEFCKKVKEVSFLKRSEMLRQWAAFAVFQPSRSVELVDFALGLTDAIPDQDIFPGNRLDSYSSVITSCLDILRELALGSPSVRSEAFDRLFRLIPQCEEYEVVGRGAEAILKEAASYEKHRNSKTCKDYAAWAVGNLQIAAPGWENLPVRDPSLFALLICPIFERTGSYLTPFGNHHRLTQFAIVPSATAEARECVLRFLEFDLFPLGDKAICSAIPVLRVAASRTYGPESRAHPGLAKSWGKARIHAFTLVEKAAASLSEPCAIVRFEKFLIKTFSNDCPKLAKRAAALVDNLPVPDIDTATIRAGIAGDLTQAPQGYGEEYEAEIEEMLRGATRMLLSEYTNVQGLIEHLERLEGDCNSYGMKVPWRLLISKISEERAAFAEDMIELALDPKTHKDSVPSRYFWQLVMGHGAATEEDRFGWVLRGLESERKTVFSDAVSLIRVFTEEQQARIEARIIELLSDLSPTFTWLLGRELTHFFILKKAFFRELADRIDFSLLDSTSVIAITRAMTSNGRLPQLKEETFRRLSKALVKIPELDSPYDSPFLSLLNESYPKIALDLYSKRIKLAGKKAEDYFAFPIERPGFEVSGKQEDEAFVRAVRKVLDSAISGEKFNLWIELFQAAALKGSSVGIDLILERIPHVEKRSDLYKLVDLLSFDGSTVVFDQPHLVSSLLEAAKQLG